MKFIHGQILGAALQAMYRHAEIVSGAYKLRNVHRGVDEDDPRWAEYDANCVMTDGGPSPRDLPYRDYEGGILFRPLTDEEKLADSLATMQRQMHLVYEMCEMLPSDHGDNER